MFKLYLDKGGGKIKQHMLLLLLVVSIAIIGISTVNAADPVITNGSSNTTLNTTVSSSSYAVSNASKVTAQSKSAVKGYWMFSTSAAKLNSNSAAALKNKGITDVFVCTRDVSGNYHYSELKNAITQLHPYGIKVHAWIVCFNCNGQFVNPSGYYAKKVRVYVKTTKHWGNKYSYKVKKKVWYKSKYIYCGKLHYKWKYTWKYVTKYKKGWIYTPVYKYVTKTGYDTSYNKKLVAGIKYINDNYAVDGIHLDYVRYSGVAKYGHAAYQQPGGVNASVNAVTAFVKSVRSVVTKQLSAAVMPEGTKNAYYYGQDYGRLADYLDFMVPMTYEENYDANNAWITTEIQYIVGQAKGKPVYAGIMTYNGDDQPNAPNSDLSADIQSARCGGASGYVLFRYDVGSCVAP